MCRARVGIHIAFLKADNHGVAPGSRRRRRVVLDGRNDVILGAHHALRGGSHANMVLAAPLIGQGPCQILTSDYYYPALLRAAFKLAQDKVVPLERAWALIHHRFPQSIYPISMLVRDKERSCSPARQVVVPEDQKPQHCRLRRQRQVRYR